MTTLITIKSGRLVVYYAADFRGVPFFTENLAQATVFELAEHAHLVRESKPFLNAIAEQFSDTVEVGLTAKGGKL